MQAYDLYLQARAALNDPLQPNAAQELDGGGRGAHEGDRARSEIYPGLLSPERGARLSLSLRRGACAGRIWRRRKRRRKRRLRLEPEREEARLALARYYYHGLSDYRRTKEELSRLPATGSHGVEYFTLASLAERRLGQWAAAVRDGERAVELDPQHAELAVNLIQTYSGLRRFEDSERVAEAARRRLGRGRRSDFGW